MQPLASETVSRYRFVVWRTRRVVIRIVKANDRQRRRRWRIGRLVAAPVGQHQRVVLSKDHGTGRSWIHGWNAFQAYRAHAVLCGDVHLSILLAVVLAEAGTGDGRGTAFRLFTTVSVDSRSSPRYRRAARFEQHQVKVSHRCRYATVGPDMALGVWWRATERASATGRIRAHQQPDACPILEVFRLQEDVGQI